MRLWRWPTFLWNGCSRDAIWPQLFGVMSAIWGVAAFSRPLFGAVMAEALSWRWAFGIFSIAGLAMAAACFPC